MASIPLGEDIDDISVGSVEECRSANIELSGEGFVESTESELMYKEVKSDEEAYELYNNYSFKHGFGTRKGKMEMRADKKTTRLRIFVCSQAGFKKSRDLSVYQKRDVRTGCKAFIQFDVDKDSGLFIVTKHYMVHNHSRVPVSQQHLIRSHRKVSDNQIAMLSNFAESGIPIADAVRVLKNEAGGEANLGFLARDAYDALKGQKR